jgi:hypothetical protein
LPTSACHGIKQISKFAIFFINFRDDPAFKGWSFGLGVINWGKTGQKYCRLGGQGSGALPVILEKKRKKSEKKVWPTSACHGIVPTSKFAIFFEHPDLVQAKPELVWTLLMILQSFWYLGAISA